jgi:hypothetical protein
MSLTAIALIGLYASATLAAQAAVTGEAVPAPSATQASAAVAYTVKPIVIANGGGASSGGIFALSGTIGQVDADPLHPASGGAYTLVGGFWAGAVPAAPGSDPIFADGFETP